jgi:hypothetical protein
VWLAQSLVRGDGVGKLKTDPQGKREEGEIGMYAAIRQYNTDPDSVDEVARRVNEEFVPLISDMQGFVAYFALNAGQGEFGSVSVFEDQQSAEESNRVAEEWVNENLGDLLPTPPNFAAGEVVAYKAQQ